MESEYENNGKAKATEPGRARKGFSLAEMLAAMVIGSMVLIAVLGIYNRAERSAAAVERRLNASRLPREILQRIAEDIDRMIAASSDAEITIQNKFDQLYPTARLAISRTFEDRANRKQKYEEIIWQCSYDFNSLTDGLVLYRSHSGIAAEDKLLDKNKEDWEKELFVPLCSGVTYFRINALRGDRRLEKWTGNLPPGIEVAISFAEPYKTVGGTLDVLEEERIIRTIAVDRTRKIRFKVPESQQTSEQEQKMPTDEPAEGEKEPSERPKQPEKERTKVRL
jgi:prepilin-type N-terminal cleavage/methylation domain-containing protein